MPFPTGESKQEAPTSQALENTLKPNSISDDASHGFVGLENFSNNCYINVVIQVLANIPEIIALFSEKSFTPYVSHGNKHGSGGKVAAAFADVVEALWTAERKTFRPSSLKIAMGSRLSMFLGYQQCDAQEFFAALLDNLHEDLNQASGDHLSSSDLPGAASSHHAAWENYCNRNNSPIAKLFHGQMTSKLTCAKCGEISTAYDPFAQISLPLPLSKVCLTLVLFHADPTRLPSLFKITVGDANGLLLQLKCILKRRTAIPSANIAIFSVIRQSYGYVAADEEAISTVMGKQYVVACERPSPTARQSSMAYIPCYQQLSSWKASVTSCTACSKKETEVIGSLKRCTGCYAVAYCCRECQISHWSHHKPRCTNHIRSQIGLPFLMSVDKRKPFLWGDFTRIFLCYAAHSVAKNPVAPTGREHVDRGGKGLLTAPFIVKCYKTKRMDSNFIVLTAADFNAKVLYDCHHICLEWYHEHCTLAPVIEQSRIQGRNNGMVVDSNDDQGKYALEDCLQLFMGPERLTADDCWKCPKCKVPRAARKELAISHPPFILSLHIKRFSFGGFGQKLSDKLEYPLSGLQLSPYVADETACDGPSATYDLIGIVCHHGTIRMGHYTCMTRLVDASDKEAIGWRYCDDEVVIRVDQKRALASDAYVLLYRMRGTKKYLLPDLPQLYPVGLELGKRQLQVTVVDGIVQSTATKEIEQQDEADERLIEELTRCCQSSVVPTKPNADGTTHNTHIQCPAPVASQMTLSASTRLDNSTPTHNTDQFNVTGDMSNINEFDLD